jgi:hypothetical protein
MCELHRINASPAAFDQGSLWQIVRLELLTKTNGAPAAVADIKRIEQPIEVDGTE